MLPDGVRRLVRDFSIKPGERAIVLGADDETLAIADELADVGIEVVKVVDLRDARPRELVAQGGKGRVRRLVLDGESYRLRPPRRVGRPAARVLAPRSGRRARRVRRRRSASSFRRSSPTASRRSAASPARALVEGRPGAGVPRQGQVLRLRLRGRDDEGHEARDRRGLRLDRAREALHDDDDGPVPGQALPPLEHPRVRAGEPDVRGRDRDDDRAAAVGAGRARPAGRPRAHAGAPRLDPLAPRGGGRDDPVGRPVEAPVRLRRAARGRGARGARVARRHRRLDAREAPRRRAGGGRAPRAPLSESLRRHEARAHPLRRPHLGRRPDHGRRHDRAARRRPLLRDDDVDRRRRGDRVVRVVERGVGLRRRDRQRDRRARRREPRRPAVARRAAATHRGRRRRAEAFKYLDAHEIEVAGVPTLALRIGFVGELGYELHFPSPAGEHLWDALVAEGARPFGLEPQRVLRLEKGHVIVGQDTDSESNLYSSGMSWLPKLDKDDFVGQVRARALRAARREGAARRLHDGGGRPPGRGRADRDRGVCPPGA